MTHGDCDGVCSASLYKSVYRKARVFFTHPHGINEDLELCINETQPDKLIILDIALNEMSWKDLVEKLNSYIEKIDITYIDHHPLPLEFNNIEVRFKFIWKEGVSASELTYKNLMDKLDEWMSRVALYGGIGDYSDETPFMKKMYGRWDKRLIYMEGGILTHSLEGSRRQYEYKRKIVEILSRNELPSNHEWIWRKALEMASKEDELREDVKLKVNNLGKISYVINISGSLGRAARYAMILGGGRVGIAIEERKDIAIMSLRTNIKNIDLNKLLRIITPKLGGSGGGHPHAAGARIPVEKLNQFMKILNTYIE